MHRCMINPNHKTVRCILVLNFVILLFFLFFFYAGTIKKHWYDCLCQKLYCNCELSVRSFATFVMEFTYLNIYYFGEREFVNGF